MIETTLVILNWVCVCVCVHSAQREHIEINSFNFISHCTVFSFPIPVFVLSHSNQTASIKMYAGNLVLKYNSIKSTFRWIDSL